MNVKLLNIENDINNEAHCTLAFYILLTIVHLEAFDSNNLTTPDKKTVLQLNRKTNLKFNKIHKL